VLVFKSQEIDRLWLFITQSPFVENPLSSLGGFSVFLIECTHVQITTDKRRTKNVHRHRSQSLDDEVW
jgi:hypothetical protein